MPVSGRATAPDAPANALTTVLVSGATTTPVPSPVSRDASMTVDGSWTWGLGETRASSGTSEAARSWAVRGGGGDQDRAGNAVAGGAASNPAVTLGSSGRRPVSSVMRRRGAAGRAPDRPSPATTGLHSSAPSRPAARVSATSAATGRGGRGAAGGGPRSRGGPPAPRPTTPPGTTRQGGGPA